MLKTTGEAAHHHRQEEGGRAHQNTEDNNIITSVEFIPKKNYKLWFQGDIAGSPQKKNSLFRWMVFCLKLE